MKLLISLIALFSVVAFAADPSDAPDAAAKEKVSGTQNTGGALKVEKTPATIEGMHEEGMHESEKKTGKKKKSKKARSHKKHKNH